MIELEVLNRNYSCRTKDLLWYKEMRLIVDLIAKEGKTLSDIKQMSEENNLFNAVSRSRANEIRAALARRIQAVDMEYLLFFLRQSPEMQKLLCVVMVILTDRTFMEFMNDIFREKLITGDTELKDSDIIGFIHSIQEKNQKAADWTDAGIKKLRDNYKAILKEAGMISDVGTVRRIFRPIVAEEVKVFLDRNGLGQIYRILAGVRE